MKTLTALILVGAFASAGAASARQPVRQTQRCQRASRHELRRACKLARAVARWDVQQGFGRQASVAYCRLRRADDAVCLVREQGVLELNQDDSGTISADSFQRAPSFAYRIGVVFAGRRAVAHSLWWDGVPWDSLRPREGLMSAG